MTPKRTKKDRATSYGDLAPSPTAVAEAVCEAAYEGQELSPGVRSAAAVAAVEARRQRMTGAEIDEFCDLVDERCRRAHAARAEWFMKCVRARGDRGRDRLYVWVRHWLAAFLMTPPSRRDRAPARRGLTTR